MRLRNVKGSREQIAANEYTIKDAEQIKGQWKDYFQDGKPIQLEIGMGKGKFLMQLAEKNPQIHYIGIEKYSSVLVRALEKMEENPLENLHFIRMDAENIVNVFEKGEVDQIYLNFSGSSSALCFMCCVNYSASPNITCLTGVSAYNSIIPMIPHTIISPAPTVTKNIANMPSEP